MSMLEGTWEIETNSGYILTMKWPRAGIRQFSGYGLPPASHVTQKAPGQHGNTHLGYVLEPRSLQAGLAWKGTSGGGRYCIEDRRTNHLYPALNYIDNPLIVRRILQNGEMRELWNVWYVGGLTMDSGSGDGHIQTGAVQLVAHDPVFYDPVEKSASVDITTEETGDELIFDTPGGVVGATSIFGTADYLTFGSSSINVSLDGGEVTTMGDWYTFPTITIVGPAAYPEIENVTAGHEITMDYAVPAGRTVTFDLRYGYKTVTDDLGTNLAGYVPATDDLADFCLWPDPLATDGENEIRLFCGGATGATSITIAWYDRYIGV